MKRSVVCVMALVLLACCGKAAPKTADKLARDPAVQIMPGVTPEMLTAGYWISRTDEPDSLLMNGEEIRELNSRTAVMHKLITISEHDKAVPAKLVAGRIKSISAYVKWLYKPNRDVISSKELAVIMDNAGLEMLNSQNLAVRFGIVTENTSQRLIPSDNILTRKNGSIHFDRLQMSALEVGTPVAILWQSIDQKWLYAQSPHTEGWVPVQNIALCSQEDVLVFEKPANFAVTVRAKTPVYLDVGLTEYYGWLSLGNIVFIDGNGELFLPARGNSGNLEIQTVYIEDKYLHNGYLPYTSRNMLNLAFEMLNAPYGWGGLYGEQDCSAYLMRVFGAVGIVLPRNSSQQAKVGESVYTKDDVLSARQALNFFGIPGATFVQFPGHIMLYVGSNTAEPYVIHAMWAFMALEDGDSVMKLPARVVLSNLNLGVHTDKGSYLDRVINIRNIVTPQNVDNR